MEPTGSQLLTIAEQSLQTWKHLIQKEARMAFLSFSSKGSAHHPKAKKMATAAKNFQERHPQTACEGELQFDAAYVQEILDKKAPQAKLDGPANCFIFPDLNSGNIAYKIAQRLGGYNAYGPLLQGFSSPLMDLSRGSTVEDIYATILITALLSQDFGGTS